MSRLLSPTKVARKPPSGKSARRQTVPRAPTVSVVAPIRGEATLAAAFEILRASDPEIVDRLVAEAGAPPLRLRTSGLEGLIWIVIGQQVSTASARAIHARLVARFPDFTAAGLLAASEEDLRGCGLSGPKMRTLRAVAQAIADGALDFDALTNLDAADAHRALTAIHGIGPWTADIYLLSCLGHPDAWPAGDLALQEAARMALGLRERPDAKRLEALSARWRPVRAVAARLLWAWYGATRAAAARQSPR